MILPAQPAKVSEYNMMDYNTSHYPIVEQITHRQLCFYQAMFGFQVELNVSLSK